MELGIYSFGEALPDAHTGIVPATAQRLVDILKLASLADEGGLEVIALGEHHRHDFTISAPEVVLAAIAVTTRRIRLASGVTVLSTQDPVRVYQQFATLDQLSGGRAEVIAGRGAFIESFPLFGYDLADYEALFDEKVHLLIALRDQPDVTWSGRFRSPLHAAAIAPRSLQALLPVWIGSGGTPASVVRAGQLGLPLFLAFFSRPEQFVPRVQLYRQAAAAAGHPPEQLRIASGGHMFVARTSQSARDKFYPYYSRYFQALGMPFARNGFPRDMFEDWVKGGLPVGSPQEVIDRILTQRELLGIDRYIGQIDAGGLPLALAQESLELFITDVAPVIRRETQA